MLLYVLRHGQTDGNAKGMFQGNIDMDLNEAGQIQAKQVGEVLKHLPVDLVISSPLKRARHTAALAAPNVPRIYDNRLRSRNHGQFSGTLRKDINWKEYWNIRDNKTYGTAEPVIHLYNRVVALLEDVKRMYPGKNILLVTHSGITRMLYYYFNGIPDDGDLSRYEATPGSLECYTLNENEKEGKK